MQDHESLPHGTATNREPAFAVFNAFLKLGVTSFGGPIAHLGYFREEFVVRRKWVDDRVYADLVALCQFTPGPASSKVGIGIGLAKAGLPGAFAAWLAFTMPSALALLLFAYGVEALAGDLGAGWLHGLKVVAVAVVAQAVWGMAKNLCPDAPRFTLAVAAAIIAMLWPTSAGQVAAIAVGAIVGCVFLGANRDDTHVTMNISLGKPVGALALALFFALLAGLPAAAALYSPVWTSAIKAPADFGLGLAAFALLVLWKLPPWLVVVLSALGGWALGKSAS